MAHDGEYIPEPWLYRLPKVSHYYGDNVRQLQLAAAALMLFTAPFYTDDFSIELPIIILGVVILVCISALTTPLKQSVINADAIASGVGLVVFEWWALFSYQSVPLYVFGLREAIALLFFFALYYSTKTLRAMKLHQIGRQESRYDFVEKPSPHLADAMEETAEEMEADRQSVVPRDEKMIEANDRAKHEYQ